MIKGIKDNFSKLSAQMPIIKPNILKVIEVINRKNIIRKGWAIFKSIKKDDVIIINVPSNNDLLAVAPTKPKIISIPDIGAACNSYIVPLNLGKNVLKDPLDILWVSKFNISSPGTMYMPYETPSISFILEPIADPKIIKYKDVVNMGDIILWKIVLFVRSISWK